LCPGMGCDILESKRERVCNTMKKMLLMMCLTLLLALCGCAGNTAVQTEPPTQPPVPEAQAATEPVHPVITENELGQVDGCDYELWKDRGTTEMVLTGGGTFTCDWSDINNALFSIGRKFDCTKTWQELGPIEVSYGADYAPVGNSYLCVYGWTREPLVEFYVVQSWGNWRPPGAQALATVEIGDSKYDIYETERVNQPSIDGTRTFKQYWSVRKGKRTEDAIDLTAHFKAWEEQGLELGKLYEVALTVEGYQSSGTAKVYRNEITVGE